MPGCLENRLLRGPDGNSRRLLLAWRQRLIGGAFVDGERNPRKTWEKRGLNRLKINAENNLLLRTKAARRQRRHLRHIEIHARNARLTVRFTARAEPT